MFFSCAIVSSALQHYMADVDLYIANHPALVHVHAKRLDKQRVVLRSSSIAAIRSRRLRWEVLPLLRPDSLPRLYYKCIIVHRTAHAPGVASCADSARDRPFVSAFWVAADRSGAIRYEQACAWRAVAMVARTSMCCEAASRWCRCLAASSICKCFRKAGPSCTALTIVYAEDRRAIIEGGRLHAMRMVATSCRFRARVLVALVGVVQVEDSGRGL
jgi:hypothetical protein